MKGKKTLLAAVKKTIYIQLDGALFDLCVLILIVSTKCVMVSSREIEYFIVTDQNIFEFKIVHFGFLFQICLCGFQIYWKLSSIRESFIFIFIFSLCITIITIYGAFFTWYQIKKFLYNMLCVNVVKQIHLAVRLNS